MYSGESRLGRPALLRLAVPIALCAVLGAGAGCSIDRLTALPQATCSTAPSPNTYQTCNADAVCPPGSICALPGARTPCDGARDCRCEVVYFPAADRDVLIKGFGASEFDLVEGATPGSFHFEAPDGTARVICAFFLADPELRGDHVANAMKSVYGTHVFTIGSRSSSPSGNAFDFRVSDLDTREDAWSCDGTITPVPAGASAYLAVTSLRAGCWAYDRTEVTAATRLHDVDVNALPEVKPAVRDCAASTGLDGRLCLPSPRAGTCARGQCVPLTGSPDAGSLPEIPSPIPDGGVSALSRVAVDGGSNTPLLTCDAKDDGRSCQVGTDFHVGRCVGSRCADQQVRDVQVPLVVSDCSLPGSTDWLNCFAPGVQGYGSCLDGQCRLRCAVDGDCQDVARLLGRDTQSNLVCVKSAADGTPSCSEAATGSYVGVCVEKTGDAGCR
jgi:hypothetical protein